MRAIHASERVGADGVAYGVPAAAAAGSVRATSAAAPLARDTTAAG